MRNPISPRLFNQELNFLVASIYAAKPAKEVCVAFARLRRLHASTDFATAKERIETGRNLGVLELLWALRPAPRARLDQAA